jgi:hypothetical protein
MRRAVMASPFLYEHGDQFPVLDSVAAFRFKSPGSIAFDLGTEADTPTLPAGSGALPAGAPRVFRAVGWADIHHPCEGHIRVRLRVCLPVRYHEPEQMRELVRSMFSALGIPADETYEAFFVSADRQTRIEQATDRDGGTDRLY